MNTNSLRRVSCLNGFWEFAFLGKVENVEALDPQTVDASFAKTLVPSAFDALPPYEGKRGTGLYRRTFHVPAGRLALIDFGAISMWSRVFVDGKLLLENACGFEPLSVMVPISDREERVLEVLVDNRYDFDRVPMHEEYFDFYQYGGILRDVRLHLLPEEGMWIDSIRVTPTEAYREGGVHVAVDLAGRTEGHVALSLVFDDGQVQKVEAAVKHGTAEVECQVPSAKVWSPDNPNMHRVRVGLFSNEGREVDALEVRFGLRQVKVEDGKLKLNGEPLILKGYNRHEWHPNFGPTTPLLQMQSDIRLMKGLGCNFVRGSHYHQDQRFLDLCDELGLLVWEENLGWGQREKTFASEKFRKDHAKALRSMLRASYNHPSIIIWGFLNEGATNEEYARPVMEETARFLRESDPSRLVSYATMFAETDLYYDLVDIISINIYPGWYGCEGVDEPISLIEPHLLSVIKSIDQRGYGQKPVLVSEIGSEGLYGWRDVHEDFFTEQYQAAYLAESIRASLSNSRCCGIALWHFSDVRTYGGGWSLRRPRAFNNKGTYDEYRRPKLAAEAVKKGFFGCEKTV